MSLIRFLWRGYSTIIRVIRRNAWTYWLAKKIPQSCRVSVRNAVEASLRKLLPVKDGQIYEVFGHHVYLDPRMSMNQEFITGTFEKNVKAIFEQLVKPGMLVVDVGAHVGFYTLLAARLVGTRGKVYAFEPQPDVRVLLTRNVSINGYQNRCHISGHALSNTAGKATFNLNTEDSSRSSLMVYTKYDAQITVETTTLDEFFSREGWPSVHFIKMDIEGAEKYALEGMRELSARNPQLKLIMEFGIDLARRSGYSGREVTNVLLELGFRTGYPLETSRKSFQLENGWPNTVYDNFLLTKEEG
jgi:FkbM family methyltransferase